MSKKHSLSAYFIFFMFIIQTQPIHTDGILDSIAAFFAGIVNTFTSSSVQPETASPSTNTAQSIQEYARLQSASVHASIKPYISIKEQQKLRQYFDLAVKSITTISAPSKDLADQYLCSALLEYIKDATYAYTYKKSHQAERAKAIAESIYGNALAYTQRQNTFNAAELAPFVGKAMKNSVKKALQTSPTPAPEPKPKPVAYQPRPPVTYFDKRTYAQEKSAIFQKALSRALSVRQQELLKKHLNCAIDIILSTENCTPLVVDEYLISALLEYINNATYSYAYKKTQNQSYAKTIANIITENALACIANMKTFDPTELIQFIGKSMKIKIREVLTKPSVTPALTNAPAQQNNTSLFFPSDACSICMESFDTTQQNFVYRIFLKPCGHDLCIACAKDYFLVHKKSLCPLCRTTVDIRQLKKDLTK